MVENLILLISVFCLLGGTAKGQLAKMVDLAERADNCRTWSEWGGCLWVKGQDAIDPWNKPVFDQLTPECKNGFFFGSIRERYGEPIEKGLAYLRNITKDKRPCGMCSYRQSCGYQCSSLPKSNFSYVNRWFVAEELCTANHLNGWSQETACNSDYDLIPHECNIWPNNPNFDLSVLDDQMKALVSSIELFNCVKSKGLDGRPKCRCCCYPYKPDPKDWKCKRY